ncbi:MAG TPA: phosphatidate cytidylyltransferase [Pontiellaceae bacterium]|nr:phosphatidate cytidylyltransferase [Pontiellaceae bacterium]HPR82490.1 phosphatidate cytidylyltransferase [Pontiellaceae bacterium]
MDKKRITLGLIIAAVLSGAMLLVPAGNIAVPLGLMAVCGLAMREVYALMERASLLASKKTGIAGGLLFVAMTWLVAKYPCPGFSGDDMLWSLLLLILMVIFFRLFGYTDARQALRNALGTLFGFLYVAFFWSFFVRLYTMGNLDEPTRAAFYLLLAVKWGDAGAYFIGSRFGKHKLFPRISPKKSWEGLLGGILFSCVVGVLWCFCTGNTLGQYSFPLYHALILGVLLPLIGTLGDLVESIFKRAVDIKDSGAIAHGMGGMLDMIDSLLFAAPFMYIYIKFFLC